MYYDSTYLSNKIMHVENGEGPERREGEDEVRGDKKKLSVKIVL